MSVFQGLAFEELSAFSTSDYDLVVSAFQPFSLSAFSLLIS
jgi:hypothetical protein